MKAHNLRNTLHPINLKKLAKPAVLCITTLLILSMLSAFSSTSVQAATATALHISGNQIFTANGTPVELKGMDYTYFMDSEGGSWMLPDGSVEFLTNPMDTTGVADLLNFMQASGCNIVRVFLTVQ